MSRTLAALIALSLAAPASALTLVQAGKLIDRPGQPVRGPSTLVVDGEKLVAILDGHVGAERYPGARIVDLRQRVVLPGLIDSHVHLTSDRAGAEGQLAGVTDSTAAFAYEAEMNAGKTVRAGFTTVRNLGDRRDGVTLALRDAIAKGWATGPRIIDAGASISTTAGHMDDRLGYADWIQHAVNTDNLCDGVESCRRAVRQQIGRGVDVIKIATTGGVNSRVGAGVKRQAFEDEARALIETAHLYGKKVAVHAHGDDGVNLALAMGADSIEHGTLLTDESIALFKKSGAYYVPTLSTINGYKERLAANPQAYAPAVLAKIKWRLEITGKSLELAMKHGVKVAFGTDAGVSKHGRNADEFELMVKHGMTPTQALQAATIHAADLLGVSKEAGTLEAGKRADMIAVDADPTRDITVLKQVKFVMAAGKVVKD